MRISDWSSDVCSSDLSKVDAGVLALREEVTAVDEVLDVCERLIRGRAGKGGVRLTLETDRGLRPIVADRIRLKIGRASCRERVCQYVSISVVAVSLKKNCRQST